jgi:hypothetical protein
MIYTIAESRSIIDRQYSDAVSKLLPKDKKKSDIWKELVERHRQAHYPDHDVNEFRGLIAKARKKKSVFTRDTAPSATYPWLEILKQIDLFDLHPDTYI